jgi:hypothetical protein
MAGGDGSAPASAQTRYRSIRCGMQAEGGRTVAAVPARDKEVNSGILPGVPVLCPPEKIKKNCIQERQNAVAGPVRPAAVQKTKLRCSFSRSQGKGVIYSFFRFHTINMCTQAPATPNMMMARAITGRASLSPGKGVRFVENPVTFPSLIWTGMVMFW